MSGRGYMTKRYGPGNEPRLSPKDRKFVDDVRYLLEHPEERHAPLPTVEWQGQTWTVADSHYDDSGQAVGSHWHLTLTNPQPTSGRHSDSEKGT